MRPVTMMASRQSPCAQARQAGVDHLRGDGDDSKVESDQRRGRERIGDAALEDQVNIHQPITNDGPAEGQRKEDQRESRELGEQAGDVKVGEVGNRVDQRERSDGEQSSPRQPFELLAFQG